MAATGFAVPLAAEEINAPDAHWHGTAPEEAATVNWARVAEDAQDVAQQKTLPADQASAKPAEIANTDQKKPAVSQESHERAFGLMPMFGVVNDASTARALTVHEKWRLFYRQTYDPFQFVMAGISSGMNQATDEFPEYGQGMKGYAKRYGAGFADNSLGAFFGNFLLPALTHDDPRYYRQGTGSFGSRWVHSWSAALISHRDNGALHPNYSNVVGNFIGCAFGNLYYPKSDRGFATTIERGMQVTAYGGLIGGFFQEFWPDIARIVFHKGPARPLAAQGSEASSPQSAAKP
jgi:hypothetical protein